MTQTTLRDLRLARELMDDFAARTGLTGDPFAKRYLWTDAFAECNFLGLSRQTGEGEYQDLALVLVEQVHHVLGRHREDDPRSGWISGLGDEEGERHPTRGGLRIGKDLPERPPDEPPDPRLEWDRDGQYFHYLTKWMQALHRVHRETSNDVFLRWAVELASTAHEAFTYRASPGGPLRMFWKMSIDLSRPLVSSMGHHDPLDALITYLNLQAVAPGSLDSEIAEADEMCQNRQWATDDALGIGGLLMDVGRLGHLVLGHGVDRRDLLDDLIEAALTSLRAFSRSGSLDLPAPQRLAFRELGLSIGLHAVERLRTGTDTSPEPASGLDSILDYHSLAERIERFWADPGNRRGPTWTGHEDINSVMLAASLSAGYL